MVAPAETAGIVVVWVALLRVAEVWLQRALTKRNGGDPTLASLLKCHDLAEKQLETLQIIKSNGEKIIEMHDVKDSNGVFLWMFPREWGRMLSTFRDTFLRHEREELLLLQKMQDEQEDQRRCLERILERRSDAPPQ